MTKSATYAGAGHPAFLVSKKHRKPGSHRQSFGLLWMTISGFLAMVVNRYRQVFSDYNSMKTGSYIMSPTLAKNNFARWEAGLVKNSAAG